MGNLLKGPATRSVAGLLLTSVIVGTGCNSAVDSRARTPVEAVSPSPDADKSRAPRKPPQHVWVALEDDDKLARVNVRTGRVLRKRNVAGGPHNLVVNEGGTVAAALWHDGRVAIVREGTVKNIFLGGAPHDVKIGARRIVVANQGSNRLQLLSLKGKRRGKIILKADPHDVAIGPGNNIAWATLEGTDELAKVNVKNRHLLKYVPTGKSPHDILFSPDDRMWVTDWNGAVHVFSRKGRLRESKALGQEAHHLAFTPDGNQVWITDHAAKRVFVLSTRSLRIKKSLRIRGAPHHVTITRDGNKAVVADHDRGLLRVFRVKTLKRVMKIAVGSGPHGIWNAP